MWVQILLSSIRATTPHVFVELLRAYGEMVSFPDDMSWSTCMYIEEV